MGFLGFNNKSNAKATNTTVSADANFNGGLRLAGNLHIEGHMKGWVIAGGEVSIAEGGSFAGNIRAARVVVNGRISGRLDCDHLEIADKGYVFGEVFSKAFIIEPGGAFVGGNLSSDEDFIRTLENLAGADAEHKRSALQSREEPTSSLAQEQSTQATTSSMRASKSMNGSG